MPEPGTTLDQVSLETSYSSGSADLVRDFYVPCLNAAITYDRSAGYFRSSVFHVVGLAFADFALRSGKMRLICSASLEPEDRAVIEGAETASLERSITRDIREVLLRPENMAVTELLGTLLSIGALSIKIAYRPHQTGIFHSKVGIFRDSQSNIVSFVGSENETQSAWNPEANYETFEVFCNWDGGERERRRIDAHESEFEALWNDRTADLRIVPLPDVPREILERYANADGIAAAVERARKELAQVRPLVPRSSRKPQRHQVAVTRSWWINRRGIIDHVTGAGKTFSALGIMREWVATPGRPVLVLVPGDLLADQWHQEISSELQGVDPRVLRVGGSQSNARWAELLDSFTHPDNLRGANFVIATMQSSCKDSFLRRIHGGAHLLVVADEVHRIGSNEHRRILQIESGGQLGLSATPERFLDPEGTAAILSYFGDKLEPHFGIREAQAAGRLVPYDYQIRTVVLSADEAARHAEITQSIVRLRAKIDKGEPGATFESLRRLLIDRARILKSAAAKPALAKEIIETELRPDDSQRWLVYCDDTVQLQQVVEELRSCGVRAQVYTSAMRGSKPETLRYFERFGGVLVSIHCLDEGIDIPSVTHALLLASSANPREQLQRRGRVLRNAGDKFSAEIFDVLVGVADPVSGFRPLESELDRARLLAEDARNRATIVLDLDEFSERMRHDEAIAFEPEETGKEEANW